MNKAWDSDAQNPHKVQAAMVAACYPSVWETESKDLWSKLARLVRNRDFQVQQDLLPQESEEPWRTTEG